MNKINKVVVFDLESTLIHISKNPINNGLGYFMLNDSYVYLRPNLHYIVHYSKKV